MGNKKEQCELDKDTTEIVDNTIDESQKENTDDFNFGDISEIDIKGKDEVSGRNKTLRLRSEIVQARFSGPLPHPSILKGYENTCLGAADRIIGMAEKQMNHRHDMEKTFLHSNSRNSLLGIIFAFFLGLVIASGGIYCVVIGKQIAGLIFGGAGLSTVIVSFISGTKMSIGINKSDSNNENTSED
ncbi:DUF2335 domain-containing protein [Clostridium perfringens]|uniref:DUF2335 domain-containing protein n=1 Tax=Clostridium perfringens TaxID=1502 RepID=UPI002247CAB6|nr:DUF2335 domain-containing protein [Clostridium perfringens]MCX0365129.1 DUF2335 domain-containing protein [Clostridium perfringens]